MNTDLPQSVTVGPYRYDVWVQVEPFVSDDKQTVLCGEADHNKGVIRVMEMSPDRKFVTFWHEILHAIDHVAETGLSEDTISRLAPILVTFLLDNGYVTRSDP